MIIILHISLFFTVNALSAADDFVKDDKKPGNISVSAGPGLFDGALVVESGSDLTGTGFSHFPVRSQKYFLDTFSLLLKGDFNITGRFSAGLVFETNIVNDSDHMEESTWYDNTGKLDLFSQSSTEMRAYHFDASLGYAFFQKKGWLITAWGGMIYRYYYFKCSDSRLSYPSGDYGSGTDTISGVVNTYQAALTIPYAGGKFFYNTRENVDVSIGIGGTPYLFLIDRNEYIARIPPVYSQGEYTGYALLFLFNIKYSIDRRWSLSGEISYFYLKAEGTQDYETGNLSSWSSDGRIENQLGKLYLYAGYTF